MGRERSGDIVSEMFDSSVLKKLIIMCMRERLGKREEEKHLPSIYYITGMANDGLLAHNNSLQQAQV